MAEGLEIAPNPDCCDVVLVNTCAFIESARQEAHDEIVRACNLKGAGSVGHVVVSGCFPQRYGESLASRYPGVDAWMGIEHLYEIADVVFSLLEKGRRGKPHVRITGNPCTVYEPPIPELVLTGAPHAFLKIAEGCNHVCAYCAIPGIRGKLRSRSPGDLVREAKSLVKAGYREIDIVAQDITAYGKDIGGKASLESLLRKIDAVKGDFWVRLLYGYPSYVTDGLMETIASSKHICKYIDIPIQHSHPDILLRMRRNDTVKHLDGLAERLRALCPGIAIRTTCIVGFPGETEDAFMHLCDYVKRSGFDYLGVFQFSPEEGTAAEKMDCPVPCEIARERMERLVALQSEISEKRFMERIGTEERMVLTRPCGNGEWIARARFQAPDVDGIVRLSGCPDGAAPGDFAQGRITGCEGYDFTAAWIG